MLTRGRRASSWPPRLPLRRRPRRTWCSCGGCWPRRRRQPTSTLFKGRRWRRRCGRRRPPPRQRGERGRRPCRHQTAVGQRWAVCLRRCLVHLCHQRRRWVAMASPSTSVVPILLATALPPLSAAWVAAALERQPNSPWPSMRQRHAPPLLPRLPGRVPRWRRYAPRRCRHWWQSRLVGLPRTCRPRLAALDRW